MRLMQTGLAVALTPPLLFGAVSCSSGNDAPTDVTAPPSAAAAPWDKELASTTCAEWVKQMTPEQKTTAAQQLLAAVRTADGVDPQPAAASVSRFVGDMDIGCPGPVMAKTTLPEATDILYSMNRGTYGQPGG